MLKREEYDMADEVDRLRSLLEEKTKEIERLKNELQQKESYPVAHERSDAALCPLPLPHHLDNPSIARYSRQLILPEIGPTGQLHLQHSSVLVVGAGGLGCPCAIYLAAAGIGRIGIVDYDEVELSNLHRQILHTEQRVGLSKSVSIATSCSALNSKVDCVPYHVALDSTNALSVIHQYDIVVDCTDNVATRYLLNDACVLSGKPLVSGSALRFEGQLTVYNHNGGPCYRCLFPKPPPPETVTNCSDGGVLGVVPGIIGCIQALETIKLAARMGVSYSKRLLLFDGLETVFRTIKLRSRQPNCEACGDYPSITELIDYVQFCGARATDKDAELHILKPSDRVTVQAYSGVLEAGEAHVLVDVRMPTELAICRLPCTDSLNIPIDSVSKEHQLQRLRNIISEKLPRCSPLPVYVVCRRGNDSQQAVSILQEQLQRVPVLIRDITGGLHAWAKHVDPNFPVY